MDKIIIVIRKRSIYLFENIFINQYLIIYQNRLNTSANTLYFHPETAEITPEIEGFTIKTSKIILKNHVWIGFEE